MLTIKTKQGEVQIKAQINAGGLVSCKSRLIEPDGYEHRYEDFIFFPDSYFSLRPVVKTYFGNKVWYTEKRGEKIIQFFVENFKPEMVWQPLNNRVLSYMKIEICKTPSYPPYSILVNDLYDWDCASNSEEKTIELAKEKYPNQEILGFNHPEHYSNK